MLELQDVALCPLVLSEGTQFCKKPQKATMRLVLCLLTHENCPAASGPLLKRTDFICGFLGAAWCDAAAVHAYVVSYHVWTLVASKCTAHDL